MANSDDFFRKIRKTGSASDIDRIFFECIPVSVEMATEICRTVRYELFNDSFSENDGKNLDNYREILGCLTDVFAMDFNEAVDVIPGQVWSILGDVCNEFSGELDETLMTYLFGKIMDAGQL